MYLGLDLGTSSLKAVLIDEAQVIIATAHSELSQLRCADGWSEQDPGDWIRAAENVFDKLYEDAPKELEGLKAIGLSGQMHGATLLDDAHNPLYQCILWNDTRSHKEARDLDECPDFRKLSGSIVFPGFTAPKLCWIRNNRPALFEKVAKVLLPKDYLRLWLTGEQVSEMSDASGTSWLNVEKRAWSTRLLDQSGMVKEQMPFLIEGTEISGQLRGKLAQRWGIPPSVVVVGGAGDNAASALAVGAIKAGQGFVSLGTSGVLFAANDRYQPKPESAIHTFCHAIPDVWHQMGVTLAATDALNWYAGVIGKSASALTGALGRDLTEPGSCVFLPYLGGERTPHNDATVRGAFTGLSHKEDQKSLTKAVLTGVAFAFKDCQTALESTGTRLNRLTAVGGGSRSDYWLLLLATILGIPIDRPVSGDLGGALGAARLAIIGAEKADPLAVATIPKDSSTFWPVSKLCLPFSVAYNDYKRHYPALKELKR